MFGEISYTESASSVKENFFWLERTKRWQRSCCQLNNVHAIFTRRALTLCYRMKEAGKSEFRDELGSASCNEHIFFFEG